MSRDAVDEERGQDCLAGARDAVYPNETAVPAGFVGAPAEPLVPAFRLGHPLARLILLLVVLLAVELVHVDVLRLQPRQYPSLSTVCFRIMSAITQPPFLSPRVEQNLTI